MVSIFEFKLVGPCSSEYIQGPCYVIATDKAELDTEARATEGSLGYALADHKLYWWNGSTWKLA